MAASSSSAISVWSQPKPPPTPPNPAPKAEAAAAKPDPSSAAGIGELLGSSLLSHMGQDLVLNYVIGLLNSSKEQADPWTHIAKGAPMVGVVFLTQWYVKKPELLMSLLERLTWSLAKPILYQQERLEWSESSDTNCILVKKIKEEWGPSSSLINGLPIYYMQPSEGSPLLLHFCPAFHASQLTNFREFAHAEHQRQLAQSVGCRFYTFTEHYVTGQIDLSVFPSRNCRALGDVIKNYFETSRWIKSNAVRIFRINGGPGLGKSTMADYLAKNSLADRVYRADTTSVRCLAMNPNSLLEQIFFSIANKPGTCAVVIDELDKYFDNWVATSYQEQRRTNANTASPVAIEEALKQELAPSPLSLEEHTALVRNAFLLRLAEMANRRDIKGPYAVILCTNNFETIFGEAGPHHQSLLSRLMAVNFVPCDVAEVSAYIRYYAEEKATAQSEELEESPELLAERLAQLGAELDSELAQLPPDLSVDYRKLNEIAIMTSYNVAGMVAEFQKLVDQPATPPQAATSNPRPPIRTPLHYIKSLIPGISPEAQAMLDAIDKKTTKAIAKAAEPSHDDDTCSDEEEREEDEEREPREEEPIPEIPLLDEIEPFETNPDLLLDLYLCRNCTTSTFRTGKLCRCDLCLRDSKLEPHDTIRYRYVYTCHACLTGVPYTPSLPECRYDVRHRFMDQVQGLLQKMGTQGPPAQRGYNALLSVSLYSWFTAPEQIEILNSATFDRFRLTVLNKIYEFHQTTREFLSSNVTRFEYCFEKLNRVKRPEFGETGSLGFEVVFHKGPLSESMAEDEPSSSDEDNSIPTPPPSDEDEPSSNENQAEAGAKED